MWQCTRLKLATRSTRYSFHDSQQLSVSQRHRHFRNLPSASAQTASSHDFCAVDFGNPSRDFLLVICTGMGRALELVREEGGINSRRWRKGQDRFTENRHTAEVALRRTTEWARGKGPNRPCPHVNSAGARFALPQATHFELASSEGGR